MRSRRWLKWLGGLGAVVVVLCRAAWTWRRCVLIHAPGMIARITNPVARNRPISWDRGPASSAASGMARGEDPPYIIFILADEQSPDDEYVYWPN